MSHVAATPYLADEARVKIISWGSVAAGALAVLAVSIVLSLLTSGLGLGMVDLQSANPLSGAGATFGWTSAIGLLLSLAVGGYLAGYLSGVAGWVHGFLTWAVAILVATYLSFAAIGGAISVSGAVIGGAANVTTTAAGAAGNAIGGAAGALGNATAALADSLTDDSITDINGDAVAARLQQAARQANLEALQPDLVQAQLTGARQDVAAAGRELVANPGNYARIVDGLLQSLGERVTTLEAAIDRDAVVTAIAANTTLTPNEVEQATDQAIAVYEDIASSARQQLAQLEETVDAAQLRLTQLQAEAVEQADRAAAAASAAAFWAFFGALFGGLVAVGAGILGARSPIQTRARY